MVRIGQQQSQTTSQQWFEATSGSTQAIKSTIKPLFLNARFVWRQQNEQTNKSNPSEI